MADIRIPVGIELITNGYKSEILRLSRDIEQSTTNIGKNIAKEVSSGIKQGAKNSNKNGGGLPPINRIQMGGFGGAEFAGQLQSIARQWLGIGAAITMARRAVTDMNKTIAELDKSITAIATVTNLSSSELWAQMPQYTAMAKEFGMSINQVYQTSLLYYQQGMATNQVTEMTANTLKMAKIAGIDVSKAADYMTNAFRSFQMEVSESNTVTDVFANLAANAATSVSELSEAMSKAATSMNAVGASFQNTSAFLTMMLETTRESSSTIGSAMASISSRYAKIQQNPLGFVDEDNTTVVLNDVDRALSSIGIDMQDANGQIRNMDDVIIELASKWSTLDKNTQSYVSTLMAGARQRSRFLAIMSDYSRLSELISTAENSENAAQLQLLKNMDSIETKQQNLQTAMQSLYTDIGLEKLTKGWLDFETNAVNSINNVSKVAGALDIGRIFYTLSTGVLPILRNIIANIQASIYQTRESILSNASQVGNQIQSEAASAGSKAGKSFANAFNSARQSGSLTSALPSAMTMLGGAVQIMALGLDDGTRKGELLSASLQAGGVAAASIGMALSGNWIGAIATAVMAIPSLVDKFYESAEERLDRLKKAAEDSKNEYLVKKGEASDLETTITKLERLKKARNDSAEAMNEYLEYSNEVASSYPELISAYDSEGNAIINVAQAYENLTIAAQESYAARKNAAKAGLEASKQEIQMFSGNFDVNDAKNFVKNGQGVGSIETTLQNNAGIFVEGAIDSLVSSFIGKEAGSNEELALINLLKENVDGFAENLEQNYNNDLAEFLNDGGIKDIPSNIVEKIYSLYESLGLDDSDVNALIANGMDYKESYGEDSASAIGVYQQQIAESFEQIGKSELAKTIRSQEATEENLQNWISLWESYYNSLDEVLRQNQIDIAKSDILLNNNKNKTGTKQIIEQNKNVLDFLSESMYDAWQTSGSGVDFETFSIENADDYIEKFDKKYVDVIDKIGEISLTELENSISGFDGVFQERAKAHWRKVNENLNTSTEEFVKEFSENYASIIGLEPDALGGILSINTISPKYIEEAKANFLHVGELADNGYYLLAQKYYNAYLDVWEAAGSNEVAQSILSTADLTTFEGIAKAAEQLRTAGAEGKIDNAEDLVKLVEQFDKNVVVNAETYIGGLQQQFKTLNDSFDKLYKSLSLDDALTQFKKLQASVPDGDSLKFDELFVMQDDGQFILSAEGYIQARKATIETFEESNELNIKNLTAQQTALDRLVKDFGTTNEQKDLFNAVKEAYSKDENGEPKWTEIDGNLTDEEQQILQSVYAKIGDNASAEDFYKALEEELTNMGVAIDEANNLYTDFTQSYERSQLSKAYAGLDFTKLTKTLEGADKANQENLLRAYIQAKFPTEDIDKKLQEILSDFTSNDIENIIEFFGDDLKPEDLQKVIEAKSVELTNALQQVTKGAGTVLDSTTVALLESEGLLEQCTTQIGGKYVSKNLKPEEIATVSQAFKDNIEALLESGFKSIEEANNQLAEINDSDNIAYSAAKEFAKVVSSNSIKSSDMAQFATSLNMTLAEFMNSYGDSFTEQLDGTYKFAGSNIRDFYEKLNLEGNDLTEAIESYYSSLSSEAAKQIESQTKNKNELSNAVKSFLSAKGKVGEKINLAYLEAIVGDENVLAAYMSQIGINYADGVGEIADAEAFANADFEALANKLISVGEQGGQELSDSLYEIKDAITQSLQEWANLISNGIGGTLSNVDANKLSEKFNLQQTDFTQTNQGLQLTQSAIANIYAQLKETNAEAAKLTFDKITSDVTKFDDELNDITDVMAKIAKLESDIDANAGNEKILSGLQKELALYKDIGIAMRDNADNFDFANKKLPESLQTGLNAWQSAADWMQTLSNIKTSGKTANMLGVEDFYNMMNFIGNQLGDTAFNFMGQATTAADMIEMGMNSLKNVDGKTYVDLSKFGVDLVGGTNSMSNNVTKAMNTLADSQITLLDGLIGMLEVVVQMEKLGDITGDDNVIDVEDLFPKVEDGKIVEISSEFQDFLKSSDELIEQANKIAINGVTFGEILTSLRDNKIEEANASLEKWGVSAEAFAGFMDKIYQAAISNGYDTHAILQSTMKQLSGISDGMTVAVDIGDNATVYLQPDGQSFEVKWDDKSVKSLLKEKGIDASQANEIIQQVLNGQNTNTEDIKLALTLTGQYEETIDTKTKETTYKVLGQSFTDYDKAMQYAGIMMQHNTNKGFTSDVVKIDKKSENLTIKFKADGGLEYAVTLDNNGEPVYTCDKLPGKEFKSEQELVDALRANYLEGTDKNYDDLSEEEQIEVNQNIGVAVTPRINVTKDLTSQEVQQEVAPIVAQGKQKLVEALKNPQDEGNAEYLAKLGGAIGLDTSGLTVEDADAIWEILKNANLESKTINLTVEASGDGAETFAPLLKENPLSRELMVNLTPGTDDSQLISLIKDESLSRDLTINVDSSGGNIENVMSAMTALDNLAKPLQIARIRSMFNQISQLSRVQFTNFTSLSDTIDTLITKIQTLTTAISQVGTPTVGSTPTQTGGYGGVNRTPTSSTGTKNTGSSSGAGRTTSTQTVSTPAKVNVDTSAFTKAAAAITTSATLAALPMTLLSTRMTTLKNSDPSSALYNASSALNNVKNSASSASSNLSTVSSRLSSLSNTNLSVKLNVTLNTIGAGAGSAVGNVFFSGPSGGRINGIVNRGASFTLAKGNTALARGTLMGELGPELVVSNGHYYTVGQSGAEFVNLPSDAIVFNHLQTKKLLEAGHINSTGAPQVSEKRSVAFASGNVQGDALASASSALATLKQLRAMWASMKSASAKDLGNMGGGNGGGGGGGDDKHASFMADLNKFYNLEKQIEKIEEHLTKLEKERSTYINAAAGDGKRYADNMKSALEYSQKELEKQRELNKLAQKYYEESVKTLNNSAYGNMIEIGEDGAVQYTSEGFELFSEILRKKADGVSLQYTDRQQYDIIERYFTSKGDKASFDKLWIKPDGERIESGKYEEVVQNFWDNTDAVKEELESYQQKLKETDEAILDLTKAIQDLQKELYENETSFENLLMTAYTDKVQEEIDALQKNADAIQSSTERYIQGLSDVLEREKSMYEAQKSSADLIKKQRQLAILQRTGGSAADIASLQNEINNSLQEEYFNKQQQQIDNIQKAVDKQNEALQRQIEIQTEALEYSKEHGLYWEEIRNMMATMTSEQLSEYIRTNTKEYAQKSTLELSQVINDNFLLIEKVLNSLDIIKTDDGYTIQRRYKNGGIIDYTGPAIVDGTKSKPESILNYEQTQMLKDLVSNRTNTSLMKAVDSITEFEKSIASSSIQNDNGVTFENVNLTIESGVIANDYDARKAGENVLDELMKIARKSGNISINRR